MKASRGKSVGEEVHISSEGTVRVALDIEGVLADIHAPFLEEYNEQFDTQFSMDSVTDWEFGVVRDHLGTETGCDDLDAFLNGVDGVFEGFLPITAGYWEAYTDPDAPDRIPTVEDATGRYVQELNEALDDTYDEYRMDIVTARTGVDEQLREWLADRGIRQGQEYDRFVVEHDKHTLPYRLYIDDNPNLADALDAEQYRDSLCFLFDRTYNRGIDVDGYVRVSSLADVPDELPTQG